MAEFYRVPNEKKNRRERERHKAKAHALKISRHIMKHGDAKSDTAYQLADTVLALFGKPKEREKAKEEIEAWETWEKY